MSVHIDRAALMREVQNGVERLAADNWPEFETSVRGLTADEIERRLAAHETWCGINPRRPVAEALARGEHVEMRVGPLSA